MRHLRMPSCAEHQLPFLYANDFWFFYNFAFLGSRQIGGYYNSDSKMACEAFYFLNNIKHNFLKRGKTSLTMLQ